MNAMLGKSSNRPGSGLLPYPIKLILVLPCKSQTRGWVLDDIEIYESIKIQLHTGALISYSVHIAPTSTKKVNSTANSTSFALFLSYYRLMTGGVYRRRILHIGFPMGQGVQI